MSLDMVQACIFGYMDSVLDQQLVAVQTGFWAAYYSNSKHPKSVQQISESMLTKHARIKDAQNKASTPRPDVDVEAFLEREAKFQAKLRQQAGE